MVNTQDIAELEAELVRVQASIKTVLENGESFRKGSSTSGFSVDFAKLPELRKYQAELKAKIATRKNFEDFI